MLATVDFDVKYSLFYETGSTKAHNVMYKFPVLKFSVNNVSTILKQENVKICLVKLLF